MYKRAVVFAGTLEGRTIAEYLAGRGVETFVRVATAYGESLLPRMENLVINSDRLTMEEMVDYLEKIRPQVVVDATHPYAAKVTENIKMACSHTNLLYLRLLRGSGNLSEYDKKKDIFYAQNVMDAVEYLEKSQGNVLLTTGSKDLKEFTKLKNYKERLYVRVLSLLNVVKECVDLGFEGKHLICMQGPFSYEMNKGMIQQFEIRYLVTKESGSPGGFVEKCQAAVDCGVKLIIIGRPSQESGHDFASCKSSLQKLFQIESRPKISLVGIGMGAKETMTLEARKALDEAELLIGAGRMLAAASNENQAVFEAYEPVRIKEYIMEHPEFEKIVIALSGDIGFFSGAKKLLKELEVFEQAGEMIQVICGISSAVYFCSKLKIPWDDVKVSSLHGKDENIIGLVQNHKKVFVIVGNQDEIQKLSHKFLYYQMEKVTLHIGERLSYPQEKIISGSPYDFIGYKGDPLSVVLIENKEAGEKNVTNGIPDEEFLRNEIPMTKQEVRSVSLSKLRLKKDSIVYDIGAGSGSVSVEMAGCVIEGKIYAIEKNAKALQLIRENKKKFAADNIEVIEGLAPEALEGLPVPTHAFIGGTAGRLREIVNLLLMKNPEIRIVLNAITLETLTETLVCLKDKALVETEIVNVQISKARDLKEYHLMQGQNPVFIISFTGGKRL
ncbi:precorrin-6A reductase [Anaerosacchariphilus polymeriproducens]|uniref:Precorrin-6A reductase n=1 Tax=Anaerosacchariphilus polymeriproducens TaxID=1812858 RepID=A0A371AYA0_9FIRM|nr:precorrin-6A reductase [Anaerosacchariphilus polymeriproducens]RDU24537.1 precorrin-6A reductase [Anaerosacchariphilus polymeriproducens]